MCCPLSAGLANQVLSIFKSLEWFFALWVILTAVNLMFVKSFFQRMVKFSNWVIKFHGFEGQIIATDKAFRIYRRDLYILLVLNLIVLMLIRVI